MVSSTVVKLTTAFVAGLVVALASALVYVRLHEATPAVVAQTPMAQVEQPPSSEPQEPSANPPEPAPTAEKAAAPEKKVSPSPVSRKAASAKPRITTRAQPQTPVQIVQNTAPAQPQYPAVSQSADQSAAAPGAQPVAPKPEPHVVELAAGTTLAVRLAETLSTEHNYTGDTFRGTLDQPVIRNGFIIVDKGSKVLGKIVDATPAGRVKGVSNLGVTLTEINTTDGQRIKVETNSVEKQGVKSTGADTAKIAGGAALGAIIGALGGGGKGAAIGAGAGGAAGTGVVLATRGKPAVLPSESRLAFQLATPVTITEKLNN
ncbi:MAG: hypothetical protein M3Y72_19010 [Acidobacteriota bacterium]|nr:hypothetical protein [Acidobacteriota bacterium]